MTLSLYPGILDTIADNKVDSTPTWGDHAIIHNLMADSIMAIESTLGTTPQTPYSTVGAALAGKIDTAPTASQVILGTGDITALVVKATAAQNIANVFEMRLNNNAIAAFIDRFGNFSAQALKVGGSLLASTHLSDAAGLAHLAGPTFSGVPTAPTAAPGANTTQLATTAFIAAAIAAAQTVPTGAIIATGATSAPTGFLICDGAAVSRSTYATLFGTIGVSYGVGDGATTFNLPDGRGRDLIGWAASGGHSDVATLGNNEGASLGSRRPKHKHVYVNPIISKPGVTITDPGHVHAIHTNASHIDNAGSFQRGDYNWGDQAWMNTGYTGISATLGSTPTATGGTVGPQTGAEPTDSAAYLVVNFIIKT